MKMVEAQVLAHPDFSKPFIIDTDASDAAIGAVLFQNIDGQEHTISYASRTSSNAEKTILCYQEGIFSACTLCEIY